MSLLKEAIINWGDVFWLHTYILFAGKPEISMGSDPINGWVRVFVKRKLIEYGDYSGSCIYRVKYDPASDTISLKKGTHTTTLKAQDYFWGQDEYKAILEIFRDDARRAAERALIGE